MPTYINMKYLHCFWHLSALEGCLIQSHLPVPESYFHHSCSCQMQEPSPESAWPLGHFLASVKQEEDHFLSYSMFCLNYLKTVADVDIIQVMWGRIPTLSLLMIRYVSYGAVCPKVHFKKLYLQQAFRCVL